MRILIALAMLFAVAPAVAAPPIVLAAASLQESLDAAADAWAAAGHERPRIAFAGTPALARQIEAGSPADLFLSADEAWADTLLAKGLLRRGSRAVLLANRLVLVVPATDPRPIGRLRDLPARLGGGRLALADPASVPAGRYAKAALEKAGVWTAIAPRVAGAENVRAALLQVARGTAAAGIVYATDARVEPGVRVAGVVPGALHPPIRYVMAVPVAARNRQGAAFGAWLRSAAGQRHFIRAGFLPPR
ncbi:molybdate ABC transporter substrate-binding protein [Sphingomonas sp. 1P06PA]|uniref:molybdate ABC transporter substrate-binding protein n=1 Tax=Sphingomonas sp. 1P06PA TaxID=554121 RepID=UPI0039A716F3